MKKTYKCFVLLLAVIAMAALCVTGVLAEGEPQIVVGSVEDAVRGTTIEVPVSLVNNPGINTFTLTVGYDKAHLSLANVTQNALGGTFLYTESTDAVSWQVGQDTAFSGQIFTLSFNVLDEATLGDTAVTITYKQGNICNRDEEDVNFDIKPGTVTVVAGEHDHNYVEDTAAAVAPTCESEGKKVYKCTICGDSYEESVDALGHDFSGEVVSSTPATCTEAATETRKCVRYDQCGETDTVTVGQPAGHDYEVVTTPATCTQDGREVSTCKNCAAGTEGHEIVKVLKSEGHKYDAGTVITPATCTAEGEKLLTCTVCAEGTEGHTKTEKIAKLPHTKPEDESLIEHKDATATEAGYDKYKCAVCGQDVEDVIPALGVKDDGNKGSASKTAPKTGDGTDMGLYILLLAVCAAGLCAVAIDMKKKEN